MEERKEAKEGEEPDSLGSCARDRGGGGGGRGKRPLPYRKNHNSSLEIRVDRAQLSPLIIICVSGSKLLYFRPNYFLSLGSAARGAGGRREPSHAGAEGGSPPRQHGGVSLAAPSAWALSARRRRH